MKRFFLTILAFAVIAMPGWVEATTYYVCSNEAICDTGAAGNTDWETGNDANNGTARGTPFLTVQAGIDAMADGGTDTLIIGKGTYTEYSTSNAIGTINNKSGASTANPHTIKAETLYNGLTGTPEVLFDGQQDVSCFGILFLGNTVRYWKFQGIKFFEFKDGIWANATLGITYTDIAIENCEFSNMLRWATHNTGIGVGIGVYGGYYVRDFTIDSCYFHDGGRLPGGMGTYEDYIHDHHIYLHGSGHEIYNSVFANPYAGWSLSMRWYLGSDDSKPSFIVANNTFY